MLYVFICDVATEALLQVVITAALQALAESCTGLHQDTEVEGH